MALFGYVCEFVISSGELLRHNMATISSIEDFRTQFEMFTVYPLLLAVCTNNSIGN